MLKCILFECGKDMKSVPNILSGGGIGVVCEKYVDSHTLSKFFMNIFGFEKNADVYTFCH